MAAASSAQGQPDHFRDLVDAAKHAALSLGVEDTYGPWELLWWLESAFAGEETANLRTVAQAALLELVGDNLVQLVEWDPATGTQRGLGAVEAAAALETPGAWNPDLPLAPHVRFTATLAGERAYRSSPTPVV